MVLQSSTSNVPLRAAAPKVAIPMTPKVMTPSTYKVNQSKVVPKSTPSILRTQNRQTVQGMQSVQLLQTNQQGGNFTYVLQGIVFI
jgi:hypothetical protein